MSGWRLHDVYYRVLVSPDISWLVDAKDPYIASIESTRYILYVGNRVSTEGHRKADIACSMMFSTRIFQFSYINWPNCQISNCDFCKVLTFKSCSDLAWRAGTCPGCRWWGARAGGRSWWRSSRGGTSPRDGDWAIQSRQYREHQMWSSTCQSSSPGAPPSCDP